MFSRRMQTKMFAFSQKAAFELFFDNLLFLLSILFVILVVTTLPNKSKCFQEIAETDY